MSERPEDPPRSPIPAAPGGAPALQRRLFIFRAAALVGGGGALMTGTRRARAQSCTDQDPDDPAGGGRNCRSRGGCTDQDPGDPPGRGRCAAPGGDVGFGHQDSSRGGGIDTVSRRRGGCTDQDPDDLPGRGRC